MTDLKRLSDEAIKVEYEAWLDLVEDENQIKGLLEVAREAERYRTDQIVSNLYILIGDTRLKDGFKESFRLAEQLHDLLAELAQLAERKE